MDYTPDIRHQGQLYLVIKIVDMDLVMESTDPTNLTCSEPR